MLCIQKSKLKSVQIMNLVWLSLRATNSILEAKPHPLHFSKVVYAPELGTPIEGTINKRKSC